METINTPQNPDENPGCVNESKTTDTFQNPDENPGCVNESKTTDTFQNPDKNLGNFNTFPTTNNTGQDDYKDDKETIESTRSKLAMVFVLGFFATIFLCFVFARIQHTSLLDLKDTIVAIIGSLSGIFGFIIGYYYKSDKQ